MSLFTVHLAVYDSLADWEPGFASAHIARPLWHRSPGTFQVRTVGPSLAPVTTMGGLRVLPDVAIADLDPSESVMLILPGNEIWSTEAFRPFADKAREFLAAGTSVAAVCGATAGLAVAGLLDDRPHTSNAPQFLQGTGYAGAQYYKDQPAVIDGDLITASGVRPVEFARAILERLEVFEPRVLASWYKLYGDHDPAGFFELMAV